MAELKNLLKQLAEEIHYLSFLLERSSRRWGDVPVEILDNIQNRLKRIGQYADELSALPDNLEWDRQTHKTFQWLNVVLMIIPTVIGLVIIVFGLRGIESVKRSNGRLAHHAAKMDTVINRQNVQIQNLSIEIPDSLGSPRPGSNSQDNPGKQNNSVGQQDFNKFFIYSIRGETDAIDLGKVDVSYLILLNATGHTLYLSVNDSDSLRIQDWFRNSVYTDSVSASLDNRVKPFQINVLDVRRLKALKKDIELHYERLHVPVNPGSFKLFINTK